MTHWVRTSALHSCYEGRHEACLECTGLRIQELPFGGKLLLQVRGHTDHICQVAADIIGQELPIKPNTCSSGTGTDPNTTVLWLGPGKWLLILDPDRLGEIQRQLKRALSTIPNLLSDVSDARTGIEVSGVLARAMLAKLCALDLSTGYFGPGQCAQSLLVRVPLLLHQVDDLPTFHLYVDRSVARYAWDWLADAASEFITDETSR